MKETTINCIAVLLGFGLGVLVTNVINNVAQPSVPVQTTTNQESVPEYVGVFYTNTWNTKESAKIEINADGTCSLPGSWYSFFGDKQCTYTVEGSKVYFYDSPNISATVGTDGLMYGSYFFKRLR